MKKQLMTIGALCAATMAIYAASDRLDIFDKAGNFVSVMVNDIKSITLGEGNDADGFTTVNVSTTYGDKNCEISSVDKIAYTPVDASIPNEIAISDAPNARVVLYDWRNNTTITAKPPSTPTNPPTDTDATPTAIPISSSRPTKDSRRLSVCADNIQARSIPTTRTSFSGATKIQISWASTHIRSICLSNLS